MTTPPFFRKVNPGDFPVSVHQPEFRHAAVVDGQRIRRDRAGAADFAVSGRRAGAGLWRAEIRRARAGRSGRRRGAQHFARRHPQRRRQDQFQLAGRHAHRAAAEHHADGVRRHAARRRTTARSWSPTATARRSSSTKSPRVIDSVENNKIASWFNDDRSIVLAIQRQPDANTVAVVDAVKDRLPTLPRAGSGLDQAWTC